MHESETHLQHHFTIFQILHYDTIFVQKIILNKRLLLVLFIFNDLYYKEILPEHTRMLSNFLQRNPGSVGRLQSSDIFWPSSP